MLPYLLLLSMSQILYLKKVFLRGDAIDTYEKMKSIFGHPMNNKVESTTLLCFYQNEIIKQMKASLYANFRNMLNLTSSINGNVLSQNRIMNDIERKFSLFFPNTKDRSKQCQRWHYLDLSSLLCLARGVKRQRQLGGNPIFFVFFFVSVQ